MIFAYHFLGPCSAGWHPYNWIKPFPLTFSELNTLPLPGVLAAEKERLPGAGGRILGITGEGFSTKGPPSHIRGVPLVLPKSEDAGVGRTAGRVGWGGFSQVVQRREGTGW